MQRYEFYFELAVNKGIFDAIYRFLLFAASLSPDISQFFLVRVTRFLTPLRVQS
jgi:hypothetical protein